MEVKEEEDYEEREEQRLYYQMKMEDDGEERKRGVWQTRKILYVCRLLSHQGKGNKK